MQSTQYMRWRLAIHAAYLRFRPDVRYQEELSEKEALLRFKLSTKIDEAVLRRQKALSAHVLKECYGNKEYSITQARTCEATFWENDYQL